MKTHYFEHRALPKLSFKKMFCVAIAVIVLSGWNLLMADDSSQDINNKQNEHYRSFVPLTSFGNQIDSKGILAYTLPFGEIEIQKQTLPLILIFSPVTICQTNVGSGWMLPIFDSHIVAVDESTMLLDFVDGRKLIFNKVNATTYSESDERKLTLLNDTAIFEDGSGMQFNYTRGLISSIKSPDGSQIIFQRSADQESVIYEGFGGQHELLIAADLKNGLITAIRTSNGMNGSISYVKRPLIQGVNGENIIGELVDSIANIRINGYQTDFYYAPTSSMQPQLIVKTSSGALLHSFVWDAASNQLQSDGNVHYEIQQQGDIFTESETSPELTNMITSSQGHYGVTINGKIVDDTYFFASGILSGKLKKQELNIDGVDVLYRYVYDEKGRVIRARQESQSGQTDVQYIYDKFDQIDKICLVKNHGEKLEYDRNYNLLRGQR